MQPAILLTHKKTIEDKRKQKRKKASPARNQKRKLRIRTNLRGSHRSNSNSKSKQTKSKRRILPSLKRHLPRNAIREGAPIPLILWQRSRKLKTKRNKQMHLISATKKRRSRLSRR